MPKSYNLSALRGLGVTDKEAQEIWRKEGINIPDELLYTPKINTFIMDAVEEQTIRELQEREHPSGTGLYTQEQAEREAAEIKDATERKLEELGRQVETIQKNFVGDNCLYLPSRIGDEISGMVELAPGMFYRIEDDKIMINSLDMIDIDLENAKD